MAIQWKSRDEAEAALSSLVLENDGFPAAGQLGLDDYQRARELGANLRTGRTVDMALIVAMAAKEGAAKKSSKPVGKQQLTWARIKKETLPPDLAEALAEVERVTTEAREQFEALFTERKPAPKGMKRVFSYKYGDIATAIAPAAGAGGQKVSFEDL